MKSSGHCFPTGGKARNSRVPVLFKFSSHTSQQLYTRARRTVHGKCIYLVLHYYFFFFFLPFILFNFSPSCSLSRLVPTTDMGKQHLSCTYFFLFLSSFSIALTSLHDS